MKFKGYALIIMAAALWSLIGSFSKVAFEEGLTPMEVSFWRALLAWVLFAGHAAVKKEVRIKWRDIPAVILFGITGVTLFYGAYLTAVARGGVALAAVLLYTAPAWVALLSAIFFRESITRIKVAALVLTLAGVAGVSLGGGSALLNGGIDFSGILFGLLAGFCYALYYIFGKYFSERYSSPNIFLYIMPIGVLGLLPWVTFAPKTPKAWLALCANAVLCTYIAYYVYYAGLRYLEATRAAITATLEPVMAGLLAYFWWQEVFSAWGYFGSGLILASVVMIVWESARSPRPVGGS